jgi:hypothetical protein
VDTTAPGGQEAEGGAKNSGIGQKKRKECLDNNKKYSGKGRRNGFKKGKKKWFEGLGRNDLEKRKQNGPGKSKKEIF